MKKTTKKIKKKEKNWHKFWKLGIEAWNTHFFNINKDNELTVVENDYVYNIHSLIKKYGTPLQIFFTFVIKERLKDLIGYFEAYMKIYDYKGKFFYHFPMKVNQNKEVILAVLSGGANLEVTSSNELFLVKKLWEKREMNKKVRVFCNGPKNETYLNLIEELRSKGMDIVPIIEGYEEIEIFARHKGDIGLRVDLNVKADTHWDNKFDRFGIPEKEILKLGVMKNLKVLHYHLGSQIKTEKSILEGIKHAFNLYVKLQKINPGLDTLDIGGGIGLPYEKKKFYKAKNLSNKIIKLLKTLSDKTGIEHPNLVVEWGQYIAAPSQLTLYKIISEKKIEKANAKAWYVIDGSFINDLKDTWAIYQRWHIIPVNRMNAKRKAIWLAGSSCDSDDKYTVGGSYILLPTLQEKKDQYIAVFDTGAYQDGLSSNHCLLPLPMKILAKGGKTRIIRKRETPEHIGRLFGWNGH